MNAARALLVSILASCALAGCPENTMPTDGSAGGDGSDIASNSDTNASPDLARACAAYSDYFNRCGVTDGNCFLAQFNGHCTDVLSHYRPELISYINTCLPGAMCSADGGTTMPMTGPCSPETFTMITPTAAQQSAAEALCAACPSVGGAGISTATDCTAAIFATRDGGGASSGTGLLLRFFDDPTADAIRTRCAMASGTDAGTSCSTTALFCMFDVIGYTPIFAACSSDAGTRDL